MTTSPPCDTAQPADALPTHGPSYYLTLPCRTFAQAVRDVSKHRDLPDWIWDELRLRRQTAEIISMAAERSKRWHR